MGQIVNIHTSLSTQVPITVSKAGSSEWPSPLMADAGISYEAAIAWKAITHRILILVKWATSGSVVKN